MDTIQPISQRTYVDANKIAENNKLLIHLAIRHFHFSPPVGYEYHDMFNQGYLGLIAAARCYNEEKLCTFSTFAVTCIKRRIQRFFNNCSVHIPFNIPKLVYKMEYKRQRYISAGKTVNDEAIRRKMKLTKSQYNTVSVAKICMFNTESLEDTIDTSRWDINELFASKETVKELLLRLSPRSAFVMRRRFGIDCHEPETLDSIGQILQLTRERVRQIEDRAIQELQKMVKMKKLPAPFVLIPANKRKKEFIFAEKVIHP